MSLLSPSFVENHKHCKAISYFVKTTTKCTNFSSAKPRVTICQSRWLFCHSVHIIDFKYGARKAIVQKNAQSLLGL